MISKCKSRLSGFAHSAVGLLYSLLSLLAVLWLSWLILAQVNFLYPVWYDLLAIDQHIKHYGPQNKYRRHFEITAKKEHQRLFASIVSAIHQQGKGLRQLRYHNTQGKPIATLLTSPELIHLQDVASLVGLFKSIGWGGAVLVLLTTTVLLWSQYPLPSLKQCLLGLIGIMLLIGAIVLLIGPVNVFYQLHVWLFPAEHQWFFYYQDSLLTTLLKAPVIFAPIVLVWLFLIVLFFVGWWWLLQRLQSIIKLK